MKAAAKYATFLALSLMLLLPVHALGKSVSVVPIKDVVDRGLAAFVERAIKEAEKLGVDAIIFEIDTPGGRVDAALIIRDAILYTETKTIAFINPRAISAGALISLAADHIVMSEGGTIGAATAVDLQGKKASEKVISYFRSEMKATAEKTGRPTDLAEAMVDEDVDIPDLAPKGKLLTLTTEEALQYKIADHKVEKLDRDEKLQEVLGLYDLSGARIIRVETNWAEVLARFFTHPIVSSLLMSLGFLGLLFELRTPGWGVGGSVGLISLGLFFWSHYLVHLAGWEGPLLFAAGAIMLLIEVLYIPGFGLVGLAGIVSIMAGLFASLMGGVEYMTFWTMKEVSRAVTSMGLAFILSILVSILVLRSLPRISFWNKLILQAAEKTEEGFRSSPSEYEHLVGATGLALTMLRPAGTGTFSGRRLDVVSEGDYIEKHKVIKIIAVEGSKIVVRQA